MGVVVSSPNEGVMQAQGQTIGLLREIKGLLEKQMVSETKNPDRKLLNVEFLNEDVNGVALNAMAFRQGSTLNVHWKEIKDAASYKVELFKYSYQNGCLYKMETIDVERNKFYVSVDGLVGNGFIIRVFAEDRSGNILAQTTGINGEGKPIIW